MLITADDKSCLLRPQWPDNSIYFRVPYKSSFYFGFLRIYWEVNYIGSIYCILNVK